MKTKNRNKLRYLLSSHKAFLDEYLSGISQEIDERIEEFFFQLDFALKVRVKHEKMLIRNIFVSHIDFLETVMVNEVEREELKGFTLLIRDFIK